MKLLEPPVTEAGAPFWDATREQRFVLPWSTATGKAMWYPREVDPADPQVTQLAADLNGPQPMPPPQSNNLLHLLGRGLGRHRPGPAPAVPAQAPGR